MEYSSAERALLWLCACTDTEERTRAALLRAAGDPERLFRDWEKFSSAVIKSGEKGVYNSSRAARERQADDFLCELRKKGYFAVTPLSDDYPESLRAISPPPLVLYGSGNRALLKERKFCIVGSRITPPWAEKQGRIVSEKFSERFAVVTGLAEGGDSAAIEGALPRGKLICVLPTGLDQCYPAGHASLKKKIEGAGLLLSEYPPAAALKKYHFHARNRILAGLSEGVLVLSAGVRSGTLITADFAAEYGRDVFAFPHNLGASQGAGCNELIKKGAYLCTCAEDILSCYGLECAASVREALTPSEERVLNVLREGGELHAALVAERAGMQVFEAIAALSSLEIKNYAVKSGGNRYAAV